MPILTPQPLIDPLLRSILRIPPSLVRYAPISATKPLRTVLLRDTPLAKGLNATFDDSCRVTVIEGDQDKLANVKLSFLSAKREFSEVHFAILTTTGQINIALGGDDTRIFIGAGCNIRAAIQLNQKSTLFIGDGTTMAQARLLVTTADMSIGDDCQFLDEVIVQCSDAHPITDLATGEVLNAKRGEVTIGRHVWVGRRALLLPHTRLGEGSIVEAGAVVTGTVAAQTMVGGAPAVVLRSHVGWARNPGQVPPALASTPTAADNTADNAET